MVEAGEEPDSGKLTTAQCEAKCKADHPAAVAKSDAVDKCWATNCTAPCIDDNGGFDAGADGGGADAAVDAGATLCGTEVTSGVGAVGGSCDQCTTAFCCVSWKGCFGEADCTAYDGCIGDCQP